METILGVKVIGRIPLQNAHGFNATTGLLDLDKTHSQRKVKVG